MKLFIVILFFCLGIASVFVYQKWQPSRSNLVGPTPSPVFTGSKASDCYAETQCSGPGPCMANPAAAFCACMGGQVQESNCLINGETHEEWQYFRQTTNMITSAELNQGWYWGEQIQKKPGTPADWVFTAAGRSSCWHAPAVACN